MKLDTPSTRPQHSRVDTRPLIILNIRLATLRERSSPAKLVYNLLTPWFDGPARECLRYIDLPFNVRQEDQAPKFRARVNKHLNNLGKYVVQMAFSAVTDTLQRLTNARIVVFVYTHSHDHTGDLYYGDHYSSPSVGMVRCLHPFK